MIHKDEDQDHVDYDVASLGPVKGFNVASLGPVKGFDLI